MIFSVHGLIADPPSLAVRIDYIDGEKVYVEICAAIFHDCHRLAHTAQAGAHGAPKLAALPESGDCPRHLRL